MRARYGLTPRWVASSRLAAHERRERLRAVRTARRRRSRGRARMKAGVACVVLQAPRLLRWQRSRQRVARWSPSYRRGRAKRSTRTNSRAAPATLRLHLGISILRQAQDRYVALGRLSVHDRGNKTMLPGCYEEPAAHIKHEHLATPLGMPPDRTATVHLTVTKTTIAL